MYVIRQLCAFDDTFVYVSSVSSLGIAFTSDIDKAIRFGDHVSVYAFYAFATCYPNFCGELVCVL